MKLSTFLATTAALAIGASAVYAEGADIFVIGGKPDDPFWSIVKRGAEDAALVVEAQGGSVTWLGPQNYDNLGVDAAELIRQAIDQGADGVIGPNWVPEAMDPAFQAVVDAGIPLVIYNAGGLEAADRLGALNYVGAVDYLAGVAGGEWLGNNGGTVGLCVNSLPGAANIEDYCNGFAEGMENTGHTATTLPLPATAQGNVTAVAQAVRAHLLQNPDINAVFATANLDAVGIVQGIQQAGKAGQVQICGINFDEAILTNIKSGQQACAIDQQGYQQGFYAVSILNGHINYGLSIPTREILTGPGVVDASNIDATMLGAGKGTR
ncbi:simple sugar transport system substrate-binding protein [Mameliella alba]|uniref:substrate-binding domain-containing protein n=1 Tax=Mameliella alba TaxID=561184 RepID=UPI0008816046|nr:substrate-binding domain-containing protein [Mameliella alba]OWV46089.1 sugar ABC transporter substrate-binding protein [Mameliella alba]PTR37074.1 simple sugar transport system substrate-binding protein [Mameliella alba]GGF76389.1 sugar ABC transporter substrate-binding protein [Mameliella alba]SDD84016.1 simple sugar transport system substrate-binding protein [Mameliella alba]